uniref:CEP63 domain-containing protein n=1 Tax=Mesocestoides corti TaxID=53468 RepID=A0A5K3F622_MESCO
MNQSENIGPCPKNFSCLTPYFDTYEGELKLLIMDLDNLVERKKLEWTSKVKEIETKLFEERRLHSEARSVLAMKEKELAKLAQHARSLEEMNESVKSDYERQIASLQSSTNLMSQNLSKLQLKYDKWRSRGRTSFVKKRDVGTSVNDAQQERKVDKMTHCGSVASHSRQFELKMQLLSKNMEIVDQRDQLNSLELAFRTQIEEIERQLKELVCLKRSQDEKILALKRQQTNHRTVRSSRLHCPPSKSMPPTSEVMVQTQISPKTESASTMTNSKYVVSSRAEDVVAKLEKDLIMKTNQIRIQT